MSKGQMVQKRKNKKIRKKKTGYKDLKSQRTKYKIKSVGY